jgi:hypothetical protein
MFTSGTYSFDVETERRREGHRCSAHRPLDSVRAEGPDRSFCTKTLHSLDVSDAMGISAAARVAISRVSPCRSTPEMPSGSQESRAVFLKAPYLHP